MKAPSGEATGSPPQRRTAARLGHACALAQRLPRSLAPKPAARANSRTPGESLPGGNRSPGRGTGLALQSVMAARTLQEVAPHFARTSLELPPAPSCGAPPEGGSQ